MTMIINGSGTIGGLVAGGLPDGTILKADMGANGTWAPAGTVLQVVSATFAATVSSTSNTYADSGLSASITPTSSTSKILVLVNVQAASSSNAYVGIKLLRNSTDVSSVLNAAFYGAGNSRSTLSGSYLDSPATTSSTTYKIQFKSSAGNATAQINADAGADVSTLTLMEIAA